HEHRDRVRSRKSRASCCHYDAGCGEWVEPEQRDRAGDAGLHRLAGRVSDLEMAAGRSQGAARHGGRGMKLVPQWRKALRMFSVQAMVLAGAIQGAWVAIPGDLKASISDDWMRYITIALMVAGVIGRLVVQPTVSGEG